MSESLSPSSKPGSTVVTVVVPAYNAGPFIRETLEAILAQTLRPEIIVVDDGSTDDTAAVVEGLGEAVILVRQENAGVSVARNTGLARARGEFICFCDADDWMAPENLELKVDYLRANPDRVLVHGWVEVTDEDLVPTGEVMKGADGWAGPALVGYIPTAIPCPSNVLTRRSLVQAVGGFDPNLSTAADFDLWVRLAAHGPVGRIDRVLVRYRRHADAMFSDLELQVRDKEYIFSKYRDDPGPAGALDWDQLARRFYLSLTKARFRRGEWGRCMADLGRFLAYSARRLMTRPPRR